LIIQQDSGKSTRVLTSDLEFWQALHDGEPVSPVCYPRSRTRARPLPYTVHRTEQSEVKLLESVCRQLAPLTIFVVHFQAEPTSKWPSIPDRYVCLKRTTEKEGLGRWGLD